MRSLRYARSTESSEVLNFFLGMPAFSTASLSLTVDSVMAFTASSKVASLPETLMDTTVMSEGAVTVALPFIVIVLSILSLSYATFRRTG